MRSVRHWENAFDGFDGARGLRRLRRLQRARGRTGASTRAVETFPEARGGFDGFDGERGLRRRTRGQRGDNGARGLRRARWKRFQKGARGLRRRTGASTAHTGATRGRRRTGASTRAVAERQKPAEKSRKKPIALRRLCFGVPPPAERPHAFGGGGFAAPQIRLRAVYPLWRLCRQTKKFFVLEASKPPRGGARGGFNGFDGARGRTGASTRAGAHGGFDGARWKRFQKHAGASTARGGAHGGARGGGKQKKCDCLQAVAYGATLTTGQLQVVQVQHKRKCYVSPHCLDNERTSKDYFAQTYAPPTHEHRTREVRPPSQQLLRASYSTRRKDNKRANQPYLPRMDTLPPDNTNGASGNGAENLER